MWIVGTEMRIYEGDDVIAGQGPKWSLYFTYPLIEPGDSGSPLFDRKGRLIGILVAGSNEGKTGAAVKSKVFKKAYNKYKGK
jgi:S1-C subfamily serine protease